MTDALKQPEALRLADSLGMFPTGARSHACAAELRRQHAEIDELRKDAARYRWMRSAVSLAEVMTMRDAVWALCDEYLDAAIDKAMENTK